MVIRLRWMATLVVLFLMVPVVSASPRVIINEIMYNPPASTGQDRDYEWVEIYNAGDGDVPLGGWRIKDNNGGYTFPEDAVIRPGEHLVIARNEVRVKSLYSGDGNFDATAVYGNATFALNNGGDTLYLKNEDGTVVDSVTYSDSWGADGNGKTLERVSPMGPSNDSSSWGESTADGGTPTYRNSVYVPFLSGLPVILVIVALLLARRW